ncbi:MAG: hypothetical protein ACOX7F_07780 [Eubacteriales bacterium]|jgi:hypothetical protein
MTKPKGTQHMVDKWLVRWNRFTGGAPGQMILAFTAVHILWLLLCYLGYYYVNDLLKVVALAVLVLVGNIPTLLCFRANPPAIEKTEADTDSVSSQFSLPVWLRELASTQSCFTFLIALELCVEGFASTFTDVEVYVLGLLLVLMFSYASRSVMGILMYELVSTVNYIAGEPLFEQVYVVLMLFTLPFGAMIHRQRGAGKAFYAYLICTSLTWLLYLWYHQENSAFGIWVYVVFGYFVVLYLLDMRINDRAKPYYCRPLRLLSYGGVCVVFWHASQTGAWNGRITVMSGYGINMVFFVVLVVMCLFYVERILRSSITLEELAVCLFYYLSFAVYIYYEFYTLTGGSLMEWYFKGAMLLLCVCTLYKMLKYRSPFFLLIPVAVLGGYLYALLTDATKIASVVLLVSAMTVVFTGLGMVTASSEGGR